MAMQLTDLIDQAPNLDMPDDLVLPNPTVLIELFDTINKSNPASLDGLDLSDGVPALMDGYHIQARQYPLLKIEQELALGRARLLGDFAIGRLDASQDTKDRQTLDGLIELRQKAVGTFVVTNLLLVSSIASRHNTRGLTKLDLIQEGNLGLMIAADKFNPEKGFKFSTYATWWIRHMINRGVNNTADTIRITEHQQQKIKLLAVEEGLLTIKLHRQPTTEELAEALEMEVDKVEEIIVDRMLRDGGVPIHGFSRDDNSSYEREFEDKQIDVESTDRHLEFGSDSEVLIADIIEALLSSNPWRKDQIERNIQIFLSRKGLTSHDEITLREVGEMHGGVTRERIRQIEDAGNEILKRNAKFRAKYRDYNV